MKYSKLMEDLREKMVSGEIQAGDRLPSENELSAQYQVSRQTVRRALSVLQNEGYIYAEHGREPSVPSGSYIRDIPIILP